MYVFMLWIVFVCEVDGNEANCMVHCCATFRGSLLLLLLDPSDRLKVRLARVCYVHMQNARMDRLN